MKASDFNYHLPKECIADHPCEKRSDSKLLCLNKKTGAIDHKHFKNLIDELNPKDLLVLNDSRVIPARVFGQKASGGKLEILIERILSENSALAHIRSSKSPKPGSTILLGEKSPTKFTVSERQEALFVIEKNDQAETSLLSWLEENGHIPLPPYIERPDEQCDKERYQTVYAEHKGSVAAPTAGLHFDKELLATIQNKGVELAYVTLHVGAGTFQPVRVDDIKDHVMHHEWICVSNETCKAIAACKKRGGRVIAIGTTTVRSLETCQTKPYSGETNIFIYPGYDFKVIDGLVTNFHLPLSTLLMLVSALAGKENILNAYKIAIEKHYRFFSYGDAMLIL
jgi:S-adenosylmethionine:tRNA ribosyltransferase-isomerase